MEETNHNISIIIPISNEEKRIARCTERTVDYLNNHTDSDFEIIVANDGSNDETADILEILSRAGNSRRIGMKNIENLVAKLARY